MEEESQAIFLVSGITGQVGGAAARRLLEEGHTVRALARDPQKAAEWAQKGVDIRQGDFNDVADVAGALDGVEGAYLMLPPFFAPAPGWPEAKAIIVTFREALRQAPPPRLVILSSVGSQQSSSLGMITATHLLEEALGDLSFPTAFVRPGSFLENYTRALETAASTGRFDSFLQPTDRTFPMVATADIGNEVARLLVGGWGGKKIVELGSPVSPDDLARAMGEALGREVQARAIPRAQWEARLEAQGMPPGFIRPYMEMEDAYNAGWIAFGVPGAAPVAGTTTPAQVFAQVRKAKAEDRNMLNTDASLTRLLDEAAIRDATARFADILMRADYDGFRTLWADDAEWVIGGTEGQPFERRAKGVDDIVSMFRDLWKGNDSFIHFAVQGVIEVNGDDATARCVCHEQARGPEGRYYRTHGVWSDRLRRSDNGWVFTSRTYHY